MRIRRRTAVAGLAAGLVLPGLPGGSAAWAADPYGPRDAAARQGGSLVVGSLVEPPGLDPFRQSADARIQVSVLMYQGLMYEDAGGTPQPLLAESVEAAPDGLTYAFRLRRGVRFHTGQPMTSADVKYSYDYIRDPKNGSPGAGDFQAIEAIETPDEHTAIFRLSKPDASLPMTLTNKYGGVVPKDAFAAQGAAQRLNQQSIGTGPFRLAAFQQGQFLRLERFRDYWENGAPYLDQVTFQFLPNSSGLLVALQNGRVDLALLSRPQDIQQVQGRPGLEVRSFPSLVQKSLDLDCDLPQLRDVRVRQAIALAIDKRAVLRAAYEGHGVVLGTMVPGMQEAWGLPPEQNPFQQPDPARARALLAEAGAANLQLDLTTIAGYDWMDPAAVTVAEQLRAVGITANIRRVELGVWINNFRSRKMGFTFNDWGTSPDPNLLFYRHFHARPEGADFRNWNDVEASRLLDEGKQALDPAKRREAYLAFQRRMAEQVPTIMLFGPNLVVATREGVRNYQQHPAGWYFGLVRTHLAR